MRLALTLFGATLALAGCSKPKERYVDAAWIRLPAVRTQPAAAYFTVHGGPTDATLIAVSSDVAIRGELHESMAAAMKAVPSVAIPAATTVAFAPGGRHVMFYDLSPTVKPGTKLTLTFSFGDGERILQDANVVDAGAAAPG